ncbi:MAG: OB-fold nucleic acid binding domain-containing protein, partial [Christensenellales bacterium]
MKRVYIGSIQPGVRAGIGGFVENIRIRKTMAFLVVQDGMGRLQLTMARAGGQFEDALARLTVGSVVTAEGMVAENPQVKLGGIEMIPDRLVVESVADAMPLSQDSSIDVRLDYRWLDLRGEKQQMV